MKRRGILRPMLTFLAALPLMMAAGAPQWLLAGSQPAAAAALAAPALVAPADGAALTSLGLALAWNAPAETTQHQLQVTPAGGDGPALNLIRSGEPSFTLPPPVFGEGPYIMLPAMSYTWRVRISDKAAFAPEDDPSWGPWSETRTFRTPARESAHLVPLFPADGAAIAGANPVLRWDNSDRDVFYYEVQVSGDARFDPDPATATSFVWWNIVHGGAANPPNSFTTPVLEPGAAYFWRVRPRIQGDGAPVIWGPTWTFGVESPAPLATPTPTPTSTPTPAPTATPSPAPTATPEPAAVYRIVYSTRIDGADQIFSMNADGSDKVRLTNNTASDTEPVWSPDGKRIAFTSTRDGLRQVYVMNRDGTEQRNLSQDSSSAYQPVWSPDSRAIAFLSTRDGKPKVYALWAADAGMPTRMDTSGSPLQDGRPSWFPDSYRIAYNTGGALYVSSFPGPRPTLLAGGAGTDEKAAVSPNGARIAFVSKRDGNPELYVMKSDGTELLRLTNSPAVDDDPQWSPDSKQIAFISDRTGDWEIFTVSADGGGAQNLTNNKASFEIGPRWSPDGKRIVFTSDRDHVPAVYAMNADGSGQIDLSKSLNLSAGPAWSPALPPGGGSPVATPTPTPRNGAALPDGIAFVSDRDRAGEIYITDTYGGRVTRLTDDFSEDSAPLWSPDRKKLVYLSQRGTTHEIYVIRADGGGSLNLTQSPADDVAPTWSPDSTRIAFASNRDGNGDIYTVNVDGTGLKRLTTDSATDSDPSWSPKGDKIAFFTDRDGPGEIYTINPDGTGLTNLTNHGAHDFAPHWSPDGTQLAFLSYVIPPPSQPTPEWDVYIIQADGTRRTNVSQSPGNDSDPAWSPDSTRLAFVSGGGARRTLSVVTLATFTKQALTNDCCRSSSPSWSPDGARIAFATNMFNNNFYIYTIKPDGSELVDITLHAARDAQPSWSSR
ncbi:MAG: hypothetical protein NTZ05_05270 [Chloroflexi bacterium]|nr:hypothetical protein [Chloroflexota bacterium]